MIIEREILENSLSNYDIIVIGGGIAGVAAAIAAARLHKRVLILEKSCALGGLATLGLVTIYLPLCDGMGNLVSAGIAQELLLSSICYGASTLPQVWQQPHTVIQRNGTRYKTRFNANNFMIKLDELIQTNNIDILFDTKVIDIIQANNNIDHLIINHKQATTYVSAKYYIDASGDGDIFHLANQPSEVSTTNRQTWWYIDNQNNQDSLHILGDNLYQDKPANSRYYDGTSVLDLTAFLIDSRAKIRIDMEKQQLINSQYYPSAIPSIPQVRMTRRLIGKYTLNEKDVDHDFNDKVGLFSDWREAGPVYALPYRCLYGEIDNLLVAGRCISSTGDTWDVSRSIPACAVSGEAAGTAAAVAFTANLAVDKIDINILQKTLLQQKVILDHPNLKRCI